MINWIEEMGGKEQAAVAVAPAIRALFTCMPVGRVSFSEDILEEAEKDGIQTVCCGESLEALYANLESLKKSLDETEGVFTGIFVEGLGYFDVIHVGEPEEVLETRLQGCIALVTGAAQGFGEGIARELVERGASVVIADLNFEQARVVAESIEEAHGPGTALAVGVDVSNEASVKAMMDAIVLKLGGLDLLVSNAGVLRAGGLEDMTLANFEFVTRINYTAFFLVTKYGSRPMKVQTRFDPDWCCDIVQVNSKSGLEGSNKNFAYAGGKFGGIGLVQSFAKELVENRIKVNAVCPGNYYEGPLWSDPEKGLFVQYLKAGKVPGAKTVEDVYRFYVSKVPMSRGCSPEDVTKAICYCVEQTYETGQAIPVTGGQNMLK